jgi:hypothetical protein
MAEIDPHFDKQVLDWLSVSSMQEMHEPDEFGTLLDIIYTGKMSDLARHAAHKLLLHINRSDDYAEWLVFRELPAHEPDEIEKILPGMQTKFVAALWKCTLDRYPGEKIWLQDMFPHAKEPQTAINSSPLEMLSNHLREFANGGITASDPLYDGETLIAFANQYNPTGQTKLNRSFQKQLAAAKDMLKAKQAA